MCQQVTGNTLSRMVIAITDLKLVAQYFVFLNRRPKIRSSCSGILLVSCSKIDLIVVRSFVVRPLRRLTRRRRLRLDKSQRPVVA